MELQSFLENIVFALTKIRPIVKIREDEHGAIVVIDVTDNISSLIGKNGANIDAIRTLAKAIGQNGKHRIKLQLNEQT